MEKILRSVLFLCLVGVISACSANLDVETADIHGYVIDRGDNTIFVVSKTPHDFSNSGGRSEFYDAITLDNAPNDVKIGDEVYVWYDGPIRESYPLGGSIGKIKIVKPDKPEGAPMNAREAIEIAINNIEEKDFIAINEVTFDAETSSWKITYTPIDLEKEKFEKYTIEISE